MTSSLKNSSEMDQISAECSQLPPDEHESPLKGKSNNFDEIDSKRFVGLRF